MLLARSSIPESLAIISDSETACNKKSRICHGIGGLQTVVVNETPLDPPLAGGVRLPHRISLCQGKGSPAMLASLAVRTRRLLNLFGHREEHAEQPLPFWCPDMARRHRAIFRQVRPYTMTGFERVAALCQSIAYVETKKIAGGGIRRQSTCARRIMARHTVQINDTLALKPVMLSVAVIVTV
jgi:hypothetical protein